MAKFSGWHILTLGNLTKYELKEVRIREAGELMQVRPSRLVI